MRNEEILMWQGERYKRFLIIQNHDLQAGFGALLLYALNGIRNAKSIDAIPVIDFNAQNVSYFYDVTKGESVWEYFFDQISPFTIEQILVWQDQGKLSKSEIHYLNSEEAAKTHQYDPDRLATFWAWEEPEDKAAWMKNKRALGRQYVQQFVVPKEAINSKVHAYVNDSFNADLVIGIHIRGTDFAYATPTPIEDYLEEVVKLLEYYKSDDYQLFVATDQEQYIDVFKEHHGDKVLCRDTIRSKNHIAPFRFEHVSGFQKGEDVLIDILLLSQCHHILKGAAATGELALWFNDNENITDFALESRFNKLTYDKLHSTYALLNVDNKDRFSLRIHNLKERVIRILITSSIGKALYGRSALLRKILKH